MIRIALATLALIVLSVPVAAQAAGPRDGCAVVKPQREAVPGFEAVVYRRASNRDLKLHVLRPTGFPGLRPAVVFFFGGGWRNGDVAVFQRQARAFVAQGYVAVLADYRVQCRDGTSPLASVDDARAAYGWARTRGAADFGIDPGRIVLSGASSGGHLALMAAIRAPAAEKPAALLLFNPAVDLVNPAPLYLKPMARGISPSVLSVADLPPTLILHGADDSVVPIGTARAFCARANAAKRVCDLVAYPGAEHGFFHTGQAYEDTLARGLAFLTPRLTPER